MSSRGYWLAATIVVLGLCLRTTEAADEKWQLIGKGSNVDLGETPIVIELRSALPDGSYVLESGSSSEPIAATVFREADRSWLATILPNVPAGKTFSYAARMLPTASSQEAQGIRFRPRDGRNLIVKIDNQLLTTYRVDAGPKPFFFPLNGPSGESHTRAFPMEKVPGEDRDHPHQRSCWFTFGNVNGVDFWSEEKGAGTIRETERKIVVDGLVLGKLRTRDDWRATDGRKICEDLRTVTFYRTKGYRLIDFEIEIHATDGDVTFHNTKEGMFGLRVASSMDVDKKTGGRITNAEGLTDNKAWGQASPWVDYVGPVQGKTLGIAILNHPQSFRYPTTWHVRTYGLFAANPFGWREFGRSENGDYTLPAGQKVRFGYRMILHEGDTSSAGLPALFEAYAKPPSVEVRVD